MTKRELNKALRKAGNQTRLADQLGFTRSFMSQIIKGKRPWPDKRANQLREFIA